MFDWHLFPHVDFNKINLDWIADCLKALMGGTTNQILSKKSEGTVANAPWGATTATIHYDTVFDANGDPT